MKHYSDENRGTLQNEQYAKQLISFEGMKYDGRNGYKNVTPTDVDGFMQLDVENCFIFFELKRYGEPPSGQRRALMRLVDLAEKSGANGILFVAQHDVDNCETVIAKQSIVKHVYWKGKWHDMRDEYTLGKCIDEYINHLHREAEAA